MITRSAIHIALSPALRRLVIQPRAYSSSTPRAARNRIFPNSVRQPSDLHSLNLLSSTSRQPLITMWTTTFCPSCQAIKPQIQKMIEQDGIGEEEGGVSFAEIELDSPLIDNLGVTYRINSLPTLLAFSRGEPQMETKLTKLEDMEDRKILEEWLRSEARRGGEGGAGGSLFGSLFGGKI